MITFCPHCGHSLPRAIVHGITSCCNCNRVFDSTPFNRILSASWLARRRNVTSADVLVQYGYAKEEAELVMKYVIEECYDHTQFIKTLKELGIAESYQTCIDLAS
jgi:hypothetical protein